MSIIKNIFQNFRKPKNSFMGRCIVKMMNETIYFWNDIVENFKEVLRVLKPEGRFYICNEACSEEGNEKWVRNIDLRIYSPIEIQRMLEQAGFINVTYDISPESQSQRICVQATKQPMMKPIDR